MTAIGIDFGTTNSVVSYFEGGEAKLFFPQNSPGRATIRSAVAWSGNGKTQIGKAAFLRRRMPGVSLVDRFKLAIGREESSTLAAKSFLAALTELYRSEHGGAEITSLVLTVPDVWLRNEGQLPYRTLLDICASLNLPLRKILSEPVAAASYFGYARASSGQEYHGHALVYDHGGGTLDLSLVRIDGTAVSTIDGIGIADSDDGVGGVHYDAAVADHLAAISGSARDLIEADRQKWLDDFETCKIELKLEIEDALATYLSSNRVPEFDDVLFEVNGVEVRASHLVTVFEDRFATQIRSRLSTIAQRHAHQIDMADGTEFRILPVGGFSSFYLVRRLLEDHFGGRSNPSIFDAQIPSAEAPYAIARGACLYSADRADVYETCPVGVALRIRDARNQPHLMEILKRGAPLRDVAKPRFGDLTISALNHGDLRIVPLSFVVEGSSTRIEFTTELPAARLLPGFASASGWRVGAFVTQDLIAHVAFETVGRSTERASVALGAIIEMAETLRSSGDDCRS